MHCGGTLKLDRCIFTGNGGSAEDLYTIYSYGTLLARRCVFAENTGSFVGVIECFGEAEFTDCQFINNMCWGIGLYQDIGAGAIRAGGVKLTMTRCSFEGNSTETRIGGGAVMSFALCTELSHCIFAGNSGDLGAAGAFSVSRDAVKVTHCTFSGNRGEPNVIESRSPSGEMVEVSNSIIWNGSRPFSSPIQNPPPFQISYSNAQGGYEGQGNIEVDPEFVQVGYWADPDDRNIEIGAGDPNSVWVMGDYHLKSQAGHWDAEIEDWVYDDTTSPCIDAGGPNAPLGDELFPNGGYVNLGAYGGTTQASRTYFGGPVCETQIAGDINGDCVVDQTDLDILLSHWLIESE